jgi:hypothetical protein
MFDLDDQQYINKLLQASISASKDKPSDVSDPIALSMAPVQLPPESLKEYLGFFYPKRRTSGAVGAPNANDLQQLVPSLSRVSYGISKFLAFAQYCVANGSTLEDKNKGDMISHLKSVASSLSIDVEPESLKEHLSSVFGVLGQGQHHVIKDSMRYKGGKDIIFSGTPGSQKSLKGGIHLKAEPIAEIMVSKSSRTEEFYGREKLGNYSADLSLRTLKACEFLHKELFGEKTSSNTQNSRKVHQKKWSYNFQGLNQKMADMMGLPIKFNFFENPDKDLAKKYSKYMSLVCIREINKNVASEWAYYLKHHLSVSKPDNASLITSEGMLLSVDFGISYCINLPGEFVNYIAQSEEGDLSLYALHTWVASWSKFYIRSSGSGTGGLKRKSLPRYIVPASRTSNLVAERRKAEYHVDEGRSNDQSITVGPIGSLMYVPSQEKADFENARKYEAKMEDLIRLSYEYGIPVTSNVTLTAEQIAESNSGEAQESIRDKKSELEEFKGTVLSYSWDYNTILTVGNTDSFKQNNIDLQGATIPDALTFADYLGFDFSEDGEKPIVKDFAESLIYMMLHIKPEEGGDFVHPDDVRYGHWGSDKDSGFIGFPPFTALFRTYTYMAIRNKVPSVVALVKKAVRELGLTTLDSNDFERGLYQDILKQDLSFQAFDIIKTGELLKRLLVYAVADSGAGPGTNLRAEAMIELGVEGFDVGVRDHPRYFDKLHSSMADFGNVYSYLGGLVFKMACLALTKVDSKDLMTQTFDGIEGLLREVTLPSFNSISIEVMPLAFMLGTLVPNAADYFEKAEAQIDSLRKDPNIGVDDIIMPGLAEGTKMFPHQLDLHGTLRKKPKHAILDVAPGGGKTISLVVDIGCVIHEDADEIKPLVIAPDHLVGNWCEDINKVTKGSWNVIPLKTETWNRWGAERLADLINSAPPNTIYVAGLNFVKSKPFLMSYGTKSVDVSGMVEFLKRFGFNYIALDESHKCKNLLSITHKAVKQLTTLSSVKYIRLATGTLVHRDITDVVGQTALLSAHIFRSLSIFNHDFDPSEADSAPRVRSKLSNHSAVLTKKKKEWAFMLPNPIDVLVSTNIVDPSNEGSEIHYQVYKAVLNEVVTQLEGEIDEKRRKEDSSDGDNPTQESDSTGDNADPDTSGHEEDFGLDEDGAEDLAKIDPNKLRYYMQRLEQLITDPWGDSVSREALEEAGITNFISTKVLDIVGRIDNHFTTYTIEEASKSTDSHSIVAWEKGMTHQELDLIDYKGLVYMARKFSDTRKRESYSSPSVKTPDSDLERWKPEARGKILIFCRYVRSVEAVFAGLPPKYKSIARRFHGSLDGEDKWANLELFKTDPDIKILIANEQSITEGQNLQIASRIIRVDSPWTPGDYEQSSARIFRPDPAAAKIGEDGKPGDMPREVIFNDWIMTNGTSEVAKVARLMWRTVEKSKFDEKGNPLYEELAEFNLAPITMSLSTLREKSTIEDFSEHFIAKAVLNEIEGTEFSTMRKKTVAKMIPLVATPIREDFSIIDSVPISSNQRIADPYKFGLERMIDYMAQHTIDDSRSPDEIGEMVKGLPVKTEFGNGTIVGIKFKYNRYKDSDGNRTLEKRPIRSVVVRMSGTEDLETFDVSIVHIPTRLTDKQFDEFFKVENTWGTAREKKLLEALRKDQEAEQEKESLRKKQERKRLKQGLDEENSKEAKAKKRRSNIDKGKDINDGVIIANKGSKMPKPAKNRVTITKSTLKSVGPDKRLKIIPSMFDGFISLHANLKDPDASSMKAFSFIEFGEYLYIETKRFERLWTIIEWIEAQAKKFKLVIDKNSEKRLGLIQEAFEDHKNMGFSATLASKIQADLPQFHRQRHIEARNKKTIKIYPIILEDRVRLAIDLNTSPSAKRFSGKIVPGATASWKHHEGMNVFFAVNKTEARKKIKEIIEGGYTVTNVDKALTDLSNLKITRRKKPK